MNGPLSLLVACVELAEQRGRFVSWFAFLQSGHQKFGFFWWEIAALDVVASPNMEKRIAGMGCKELVLFI